MLTRLLRTVSVLGLGAAFVLASPARSTAQGSGRAFHPHKRSGAGALRQSIHIPSLASIRPGGGNRQSRANPVGPHGKHPGASNGPGMRISPPGISAAAQTLFRNWETIKQSGVAYTPDFSCAAGPNNI